MKKSVAVLLSSALLTGILGIGLGNAALPASAAAMSVTVDGKPLSSGGDVVLSNNHALVAASALAQSVGAKAAYDQSSKTITVTKDANVFRFTPGSKTAEINGGSISLDTPASLVHGTPYVPVRFLAENLGMSVSFEKATNSIALKSAEAPALRIVSPANGEILYSDQVKVSVSAIHHQLADFRQHTQATAGQGHIHVWLDTDPTNPKLAYKMINGEPAVFDKVPPGTHKLTVQLVGNDHKPISPVVKKVIHFQTKAASGYTGATSHASTSTSKPAPAPATHAQAPVSKNYTVNIQSFAFAPGSLTVEAGSTITFKNFDDVVHTVTAKDRTFDSGPIAKGASYTATFTKPGVYSIYCKPHTFMTGTITVK